MSSEPWMVDPRCPKCGVVYPRKRVGESMTFIVDSEHEKKCGYKGPIPWPKQGKEKT